MAGGTHVDDLTSILASGVAESDLVYVGAVGDPDPDRKMTVAELRTLLYRYIASGAPARITLGRSPANAAETAQLDFLELDSGSEDAEFGDAVGSYGMRVEYDGADNVMRWKGAVLSSEQTLMELDRNGTPANLTLSNGNLRLGTAGRGIDFSGVGTAAETLDDYEEGTFTPSILQGFGTVNYNSGSTTGSYTRIGNRVFWTWRVATTSQVSPSTNSIVVSTPLTLSGSKGIGHLTMWLGVNVDAGRQGGIGGYTTSAGTGFLLYMSGDSISWSPITGTDLGTGSFQMIGVGQGEIA